MTPQAFSKFWHDVVEAYTQVSINHELEVTITSDAEDLTAVVRHDSMYDVTTIEITSAKTGRTEVRTDATDRA